MYLALQGRRGEKLRLGLVRALQNGYRCRPGILLQKGQHIAEQLPRRGTDGFLEPAQVVDRDLLLIVVPAPHGQHSCQHVGDRESLLSPIGSHGDGSRQSSRESGTSGRKGRD